MLTVIWVLTVGNCCRLCTHGVLCAQGEEVKKLLKEQRLISKDLEQQNGSIAGGLEQTVAPSTSSSGNLHDLPYKDAPCSDAGIMQSHGCSAEAQVTYLKCRVVLQTSL